MRRSALVFACLLCFTAPGLAEDVRLPSAAIEAAPAALSPGGPAKLVEIAGLDRIFESFGETLANSARQSGTGDERFFRAWEESAHDAFARADLSTALEASLMAQLGRDEVEGIEAFHASLAGSRIAALEATTQAIAPEHQLDAIAKGQATYLAASNRRRGQIEELMSLSQAEFTFALLAESLRGMAVGLHLSNGGDIIVPWEEIDAGVTAELAGMREALREASRGVLAYTYMPLSDDELEAYLVFMRAPATQKFYGIATVVIGTAIRDTMATLGDAVARKLAAVAI